MQLCDTLCYSILQSHSRGSARGRALAIVLLVISISHLKFQDTHRLWWAFFSLNFFDNIALQVNWRQFIYFAIYAMTSVDIWTMVTIHIAILMTSNINRSHIDPYYTSRIISPFKSHNLQGFDLSFSSALKAVLGYFLNENFDVRSTYSATLSKASTKLLIIWR
jgi:hypothetical protein